MDLYILLVVYHKKQLNFIQLFYFLSFYSTILATTGCMADIGLYVSV